MQVSESDLKSDGWVPFTMHKDRVTGQWVNGPAPSAPSASASRTDSASAAKSDNNVNCFMFCLGISTANSGSAANSDNRNNSPGNTATSMPVEP